jgi:hypothetical protein
MKLFTRDELISLYRRSVGLQKDVPNDAVARQTKRWSKRTLAGKIHGLVKARTFGMVDGIVVAVAAILVWVGAMWRFRRGDGRTTEDDVTHDGGRGGSRRAFIDGPAWVATDDTPEASDGMMAPRRMQQEERPGLEGAVTPEATLDKERGVYNSIGTIAETQATQPQATQPQATQPRATQRILIATLCAVIAGGGWAGIAHGINVSARTRIRNRFAKHLRTLRAKRPSATSRRLTRFVKRFGRTK